MFLIGTGRGGLRKGTTVVTVCGIVFDRCCYYKARLIGAAGCGLPTANAGVAVS